MSRRARAPATPGWSSPKRCSHRETTSCSSTSEPWSWTMKPAWLAPMTSAQASHRDYRSRRQGGWPERGRRGKLHSLPQVVCRETAAMTRRPTSLTVDGARTTSLRVTSARSDRRDRHHGRCAAKSMTFTSISFGRIKIGGGATTLRQCRRDIRCGH